MKKAIEYSLKAEKSEFHSVKIDNSNTAADYARQFYHDDLLIYESSFIILLNIAQNVIGYAKISQGGVCGTVVDPRIIAKYAIESLSSGVIFVHNHPSGNLKPSVQDKQLVRCLSDGLNIFDIKLVDSIILSEDSYYSMADEGMI